MKETTIKQIETPKPKPKKRKAIQARCLECGHRFYSIYSAERAYFDGCPGCGGSDIDIA